MVKYGKGPWSSNALRPRAYARFGVEEKQLSSKWSEIAKRAPSWFELMTNTEGSKITKSSFGSVVLRKLSEITPSDANPCAWSEASSFCIFLYCFILFH